jgi:ribonuclease D
MSELNRQLASFMENTTANPIWVDEPAAFRQMLESLHNNDIIALDTESDSLYSYYEKVCLIQISVPDADYLVDPLFADVRPLGEFFADPRKQKVFHAAEYDLICLKRDFGFEFVNIFDTMLAARILGWRHFGLASILAELFSIKLNKHYQRYNWGKRPLEKEAIQYASSDSHYLLPLRAVQLNDLEAKGRYTEAQEAFFRLSQTKPICKAFNADDFWRIKGAHELSPREQAILRQLFIFRDEHARELDIPAFKLFNDATLVRLAEAQPPNIKELGRLKGINPLTLHHIGEGILAAIKQGQTSSPPSPKRNNSARLSEDVTVRYENLRRWRNELAKTRGVEPSIICSNEVLLQVARHDPRQLKQLEELKALGNWQLKAYGEQMIEVLKQRSRLSPSSEENTI